MCTVSYIPLPDGGYILTTNRDESPTRAAVQFPCFHQVYGKEIIYPRDGNAGGSWVGATDFGITGVIMNGAHAPHVRKPPYRLSRGLVLLEALECIRPVEFVRNYDFSGIEPFTMLLIYDDKDRNILEFRWDGESGWHRNHHPGAPHIWASNMLYDENALELRKAWFSQWMDSRPKLTQDTIIDFHLNAGSEDPHTAMRMNRDNRVATIGVTSIQMGPNTSNMQYLDLRKNSKAEIAFQQLPSTMYNYVYDQ